MIKDSWEYEERPEERLLLKKATETGVENVARYYYHETVHISGIVDQTAIQGVLHQGARVACH